MLIQDAKAHHRRITDEWNSKEPGKGGRFIKKKEKEEISSRVLRDSTPRYVGRSVGRLVGWSVPFLLFRHF